jgi:DNA helicase II / ATP-dependent DNA helicase PcrA
MSEFSKAYAQLNDQQKAAVDQTNGAVLVIAGPGTGKTQLLSLRVANILKQTDAQPENILCLTFTNKAANNMQLRLSKLVGSSAQKVMIKTFHSFASEIMSLYPENFWNGAKLTNVPDALQLEIITDILSSLPLDNPLALKFAGQFTSTRDVMDALRLSKEAGLTPDKLRALIQLNLDYIEIAEPELVDICADRLSYKTLDEMALKIESLPQQDTDALTRPLVALSTIIHESFEAAHTLDDGTNKTANTSAWKTRWIQSVEGIKGMHKERERNGWWLSLADVYEAYRGRLHDSGYYDYSDMIIEVITQLEKTPGMRADIQERFQYVLIDEFQDTNAAQLRLSHLVADHEAAEGNPNIMAVGDDDQSIYKFNGAELSNMLGFTRSYQNANVFVLTDNYRSSQDILDFSLKIIGQATERLSTKQANITKELIAKNAPINEGAIEHISYPTKLHQYDGIAKKIADTKTKNPNQSIAVVARSHDSLRAVANALKIHKVPVRYEQQQSVLEQPIIKQISYVSEVINAINAGDEITSNTYLPKLLANEAWGISKEILWHLAIVNRNKPHWIDSLLKNKDENLITIANWLLWLASQAQSQPLSRMIELILGLSASEHYTSPLREYYLTLKDIDTPYLANISAVHKLTTLAQDFSAHGQITIADFVRLIHVTQDNNRPITDESLFVTAPDAVELLTVHKAKGLEFDSVFVVDAMESVWKPGVGGRKPPSNLPLRPSGDTYDDYVRLMFVAITRAKQNIFIASYYTGDDGQESVPSSIVRDVLPAYKVPYYVAGALPILENALIWPRLEGSREKELLLDILSEFTLSPSSFLDFLDISKGGPQNFLEKYLLKLPQAQSALAAFGNAIHSSLETGQHLTIDGNFSISEVLKAYEIALKKQELPQNDYARYLTHGQNVLKRLFNDYEVVLPANGKPEFKLNAYIQGTPLSGKLDRIDINIIDGTVLITDYKTSTPLVNFYTKNKGLAVKAWRHRTQLELYALMVQNSPFNKGIKNIETQMMYVEAETPKELVRKYSPEQHNLSRLSKLVEIVSDKITRLNLPDTRHYDETYEGIKKFEDDLLNGII